MGGTLAQGRGFQGSGLGKGLEKELAGPYRRRRDFRLQPDADSSYIRYLRAGSLHPAAPEALPLLKEHNAHS